MTLNLDSKYVLRLDAVVAKAEELNDTSVDQSDWDPNSSVYGKIILMYIPGIIYCNSLVFWSIILYPGFYMPHNIHLLSLSIGDLLVGFARIPLSALKIAPSTAHLINGNRYSCFTFVFFEDITVNGSLHSLLFMGIDSYVAIAFPFLYATKITVSTTIKILACMWAYTLIMPVIGLEILNESSSFSNYTSDKCESFSLYSDWYSMLTGNFTPYVCIIVPVCLYIHIFIIACRHRRAIKRLNIRRKSSGQVTTAPHHRFSIRLSGAKMSSARTFIFIFMWMPILGASMYINSHFNHMSTQEVQYLWDVTASLFYVSHIMSALVYSIGAKEYRDVYKLMTVTAPWNWKTELRRLFIKRQSELYAKRSTLLRGSCRTSSRCTRSKSLSVKPSMKLSLKSSIKSSLKPSIMDPSTAKSISKVANLGTETELERKKTCEAIPHDGTSV